MGEADDQTGDGSLDDMYINDPPDAPGSASGSAATFSPATAASRKRSAEDLPTAAYRAAPPTSGMAKANGQGDSFFAMGGGDVRHSSETAPFDLLGPGPNYASSSQVSLGDAWHDTASGGPSPEVSVCLDYVANS